MGEKFNTDFNFPNGPGGVLDASTNSVYDITFSPSTLVLNSDLSNLFATTDASGNPYIAAAHLAGYKNGNKQSGVSGVLASPEPSTLLITAIGPIGFVGYGLNRRRIAQRIRRHQASPSIRLPMSASEANGISSSSGSLLDTPRFAGTDILLRYRSGKVRASNVIFAARRFTCTLYSHIEETTPSAHNAGPPRREVGSEPLQIDNVSMLTHHVVSRSR